MGRFQKRPTREGASPSSWSETTNNDYLSRDEIGSVALSFPHLLRFVDAHNVDRGVLVSVQETVTSIAVSILTSQYIMNLLSLLQNYLLIPSFENAGEDRATLAATLSRPS